MFSAADLIEILQVRHRRRFPVHADRPFGGFPPTWRAWFMAMGERVGTVAGAPVADYLDVFLARPLRPRPKAAPPLDRWRAFARLARQQWEPAPRDQRGLRRFAAAFSGLLHLVFGVLLLWLGFVQLGDAPPEAQQAGESILIEYIGDGTPAETGGAPAAGESDAPASAAASASTSTPVAAAAASAPYVPPTPPDVRQADTTPSQPAPSQPMPPEEAPSPPVDAAAPQPLAVTETPTTDIDFTLPAPVPIDPTIPRPALRVPEVAAQATEVETFKATTAVPNVQRPTPRPAMPTVPVLRTEVTEVEAQRAPAPVVARQVSPSAQRTPALRVPEMRTVPGEVQVRAPPAPAAATAGASTAAPTPSRVPATGTAPSPGTASPPATAATSGGRPQATATGRPAAAAPAGAGPTPSPRPGAAPSTVRSDDWGASDRNVPGNSTAGRSPGLFNSDGSVRLPGDGGRVGGGLPPGTVIEDFEKIDRMGTWLKRPPLDYTPTRFDRFWIPNRSLLEEWVSRGIKNVAIPIPGTTKRILCTVSLLQGGGGCTIHDPNLQDQEAIARPPPDVPFKPELQEDRDSLPRTNGP
ncbi:hypothetical protein [Lysobacter hankyongensis]|uniref:Transmembrane repetitive protein n=1 Tax=Lysobacter hankyongensis TaxID=1176535 RepID=A0ABP9BX20_9GAMM